MLYMRALPNNHVLSLNFGQQCARFQMKVNLKYVCIPTWKHQFLQDH